MSTRDDDIEEAYATDADNTAQLLAGLRNKTYWRDWADVKADVLKGEPQCGSAQSPAAPSSTPEVKAHAAPSTG